ncbi:hypothetical protein BGZ63DRAFT_215439 [Mariannaea sp. PMI_226]|nr:hypothetical protein BGZ63DRAFT_215439 [Mariannaea sp. PMI_226]
MSAKAKSNPLNGVHTAGIFADMSVDGPIIGTLVAIVDRAKNLPNRKTIGKQDPYCAARLGKEAKKTKTDIRGGQTPKWDQELRFPVHDCPDYYQLKISVFTDDKKTDLIGESWIDLRAIIIPGGGQNDVWQTLSCRGKYAGEIRLEITFYDSRPKPEKPAAMKSKQPTSDEGQGSIKQRTPVKRRPLPSDPVTGEAPQAPAAQPAALPAASPAAPAALPPTPEQNTPPPRAHAQQPSHGSHIAIQSPLQSVEYSTPPSHRNRHADHHSQSPHAITPNEYTTPTRGERPRGARRSMNPPQELPTRHHDEPDYNSPKYPAHPQDQLVDHQGYHAPPLDAYDTPPMEDPRQYALVEMDRAPPPPPAHRSRHNSGGQELALRSSYDASPPKSSQPPMRHGVLRNEAHRLSTPTYPGRPTFRGYDIASSPNQGSPQSYDASPRTSSYDANYDPHHRLSLQPTVEDAPETPSSYQNNHRYSVSRLQQQDEMCFDDSNSKALQLSRSPGGSPFPEEYSPSPASHSYEEHNPYQIVPISQARDRDYRRHSGQEFTSPGQDYSRSPGYDQNPYQIVPVSQTRSRDYSRSPGQDMNSYQVVPANGSFSRDISRSPGQISYHPQSSQTQHSNQRPEMETRLIQSSNSHSMPVTPASLVPGLDPVLAQEVTDSIYSDRRDRPRHHSQSVSTPSRGRPRAESHQTYPETPDNSQSYAIQPYNRRALTYTGGSEPLAATGREVSPNPWTSPDPRNPSVSPNPQHVIRRKSVSPAPPPNDTRRLSGVPFGPDAYDELNPSLVSSTSGDCISADSNKIITYDGREIDPSDHLPIESWAPEPETKQKEPSPEPRSRPALTGAQPLPPSSRRTPRTGRHSMSAASSPYYAPEEPRTPVSTGRNRLQKRNPNSAGPSPAGVSPLAPLPPDNYQDRHNSYNTTPTRSLPRASTWDHQNENRAPQYSSGPPIPAKVPLPLMSGANGGGNELALMQEMQRIDIGSGRSRRRGGY